MSVPSTFTMSLRSRSVSTKPLSTEIVPKSRKRESSTTEYPLRKRRHVETPVVKGLAEELEELKKQHQKELEECRQQQLGDIRECRKEVDRLKERLRFSASLLRTMQDRLLEETSLAVKQAQDKLFSERSKVYELQAKIREMSEKHVERQMSIPLNEERVLSSMTCSVCLSYYNQETQPYSGTCGHSVCGYCFEILPTRNCPSCRAPGSFQDKNKNFLASNIIEAFTEREREDSSKKNPGTEMIPSS